MVLGENNSLTNNQQHELQSAIKKKKKRPKSTADNFTNAKLMKSNLTQDLEPSLFKFLNTDSSPIRKHMIDTNNHPPIPELTPP